jgi:hypothetical protein
MLAYGSAHWASRKNNASTWAFKPRLACLGLPLFFLSFKRVDDKLSGPFYFFLLKYGDNTLFLSPDSGHHCDGLKIRAMGFNLQSPFFNFFKAKTHKTSPKTCINQFSNPINPKKQLISQNKIE